MVGPKRTSRLPKRAVLCLGHTIKPIMRWCSSSSTLHMLARTLCSRISQKIPPMVVVVQSAPLLQAKQYVTSPTAVAPSVGELASCMLPLHNLNSLPSITLC